MGRNRKTVATTKKHLTKDEKKKREEIEKKVKLNNEQLLPTDILLDNPIALEEFNRVVEQAKQINLWDNLDLTTLIIYCHSYAHYCDLEQQIKVRGYTVEGKESEKISPLVTAQQKYADRIAQCSSKLGIATIDRLKVVVPEPDSKENKFAKYIKNG